MTTFQTVSSPRFAKIDVGIRGDGTEEDLEKLFSRNLEIMDRRIGDRTIGELLDAAWRALENGSLKTCAEYRVLVNHS